MQKRHYTGYITVTVDPDTVAMDIPTMRDSNAEQYASYLDELFFIDHHDVLRSNFGEYPIAVTEEQYDQLIAYLQQRKTRFN